MRTIHGVLLLGLLVGCADDPQGSCIARCEERREARCEGFSGFEDCFVRCQDTELALAESRRVADEAGCRAELEAILTCQDEGPACGAASRCRDPQRDYQRCLDAASSS
jgi:hypothetical protein